MICNGWKRWLGTKDDAKGEGPLARLHRTEQFFVGMHWGIVLLFLECMPNLWRQIINWIRNTAQITVRVAVRLLRVTVVASAWIAIVFGPFCIYPGFASGICACLALLGSVWGLRRQF